MATASGNVRNETRTARGSARPQTGSWPDASGSQVFLNFTHSSSRAIIKSEPWIPVSPEERGQEALAAARREAPPPRYRYTREPAGEDIDRTN
ncbi:hypothetical protein F2P81_002103 [Scophthalmus maximus]|uniref:Uncharacterized protein n=1 Tax=Scophthalmus maximus TaxID=52904 RepID=A0A6A4TQR5_SCOMX|nr:hypothetical protein F2P81_002103 [Scophthalmus maximus]